MDIPGFAGPVLTDADPGYDQARTIWNGAIDRRPAVIARCTGAADAAAAVRFARERDLLISVRSGGHGVSGAALNDGGIVIDLSAMKGTRVDPAARTATVQAGVLLGELDHETQAYGLAAPAGIVTHTGVAGLTLGGGIGWLMRKHGLTIDNLTGCDVVTADGAFVHANERDNPDLFWGLRGAGPNFGIVTSFEFRLQPVGPEVLAGPIFWPIENAVEVLRFYRDFIRDVPDDLTTILSVRKLLPLPAFPTELHGRAVCGVMACWAGDIAEGERALEPLRRFSKPLIDLVGRKPFVAHQAMLDPGVRHGWHYYWKSMELPELKDDTIDLLAEHGSTIGSPLSYFLVFQLGGAISRVGEDATSYTNRGAAHNLNINGVWRSGQPLADQEIAWTRGLFGALEPYQSGVYVNFLGDEGADRVREAYGEAKYAHLVALKDRYDPDNVFRMNQNIKPSR